MLLLRVPVWIALTLVGFIGNIVMSGFAPTLCARRHGAVRRRLGLYAVGAAAVHPDGRGRLGDRPVVRPVQGRAHHVRRHARRAGGRRRWRASACFGAVCGSSVATAATMTRIALPEMRKAGYDPGLAAGSLAAGGSIGILVPPSIILVIYAAIAEQSVPRLFAAGLVPGPYPDRALHDGRHRWSPISARITRRPAPACRCANGSPP